MSTKTSDVYKTPWIVASMMHDGFYDGVKKVHMYYHWSGHSVGNWRKTRVDYIHWNPGAPYPMIDLWARIPRDGIIAPLKEALILRGEYDTSKRVRL